jgi:anti-sigma-K factor RskA
MAVNDNDMDLLHEYVDGELPVAECEGLWRRLAIEREMAAELERLRADHAVRAMAWKSLEPEESTVARLEAKIMRASRREDFMSWAGNALRIGASAAALILFGVSVGWMGKDRYGGAPVVSHSTPSDVPHTASSVLDGTTPAMKYNVELRDRSGKLLAPIQEFDTLEEARQFAHDVQAGQTSPGGADWNVEPAVNKF